MNKDQVIAKLYKLAKKQQNLLKRAQELPAANLNPQSFGANPEEKVIYNRIDPAHKAAIMDLKVQDGVVKVKFNSGMGSDEAFAALQAAVTSAVEANALPRSSYQIQEVL